MTPRENAPSGARLVPGLRARGLVGAGAEGMLSTVAVIAKKLKAILWEFMATKPKYQRRSSYSLTMFRAIVQYMVDRKKSSLLLPATCTFASIGGENLVPSAIPARFAVLRFVRCPNFRHTFAAARMVGIRILSVVFPKAFEAFGFAAERTSTSASRNWDLPIWTAWVPLVTAPSLSSSFPVTRFAAVGPAGRIGLTGKVLPRSEVLVHGAPNRTQRPTWSFGWHSQIITFVPKGGN